MADSESSVSIGESDMPSLKDVWLQLKQLFGCAETKDRTTVETFEEDLDKLLIALQKFLPGISGNELLPNNNNDTNFKLMRLYDYYRLIEQRGIHSSENFHKHTELRRQISRAFSEKLAKREVYRHLEKLLDADKVSLMKTDSGEQILDLFVENNFAQPIDIDLPELENRGHQSTIFESGDFAAVFLATEESGQWLMAQKVTTSSQSWSEKAAEFLNENSAAIGALFKGLNFSPITLQQENTVPKCSGEASKIGSEIAALFESRLLKRHDKVETADQWEAGGREKFTGQIEDFVKAGKPLLFVLPSFPSKSSNFAGKVLSRWPDLAENLALRRLGDFVESANEIYPRGAHLVLFGDGRVFCDCYDWPDDKVDDYIDALHRMGLPEMIHWSDLDMFFPGLTPDGMRQALVALFGESIETVSERIASDDRQRLKHCGFLRFMGDELQLCEAKKLSRRQAHRRLSETSRQMVQRGEAMSLLIQTVFPAHVRLSVRPSDNASKFGVKLVGEKDDRTPWHSCVLRRRDGSVELVRRAAAESEGHRLALSEDGLPYYEEM